MSPTPENQASGALELRKLKRISRNSEQGMKILVVFCVFLLVFVNIASANFLSDGFRKISEPNGVNAICTFKYNDTRFVYDDLEKSTYYSCTPSSNCSEESSSFYIDLCKTASYSQCVNRSVSTPACEVNTTGDAISWGDLFYEPMIAPIDREDTSKGLLVTYLNGDACTSSLSIKRSATYHLECSEEEKGVYRAYVDDLDPCKLHIHLASPYCCPYIPPFMSNSEVVSCPDYFNDDGMPRPRSLTFYGYLNDDDACGGDNEPIWMRFNECYTFSVNPDFSVSYTCDDLRDCYVRSWSIDNFMKCLYKGNVSDAAVYSAMWCNEDRVSLYYGSDCWGEPMGTLRMLENISSCHPNKVCPNIFEKTEIDFYPSSSSSYHKKDNSGLITIIVVFVIQSVWLSIMVLFSIVVLVILCIITAFIAAYLRGRKRTSFATAEIPTFTA